MAINVIGYKWGYHKVELPNDPAQHTLKGI